MAIIYIAFDKNAHVTWGLTQGVVLASWWGSIWIGFPRPAVFISRGRNLHVAWQLTESDG